jgi:hypothetical protein
VEHDEEPRQFLLALKLRLDTNAATAVDDAMLAAPPACHVQSAELVRALCELQQGRATPTGGARQ